MSYFSNKNTRFINSFEISILSSFGFPRATSGFIWDLFGPPLVSTWTSWTPFGAPLGSLVGEVGVLCHIEVGGGPRNPQLFCAALRVLAFPVQCLCAVISLLYIFLSCVPTLACTP